MKDSHQHPVARAFARRNLAGLATALLSLSPSGAAQSSIDWMTYLGGSSQDTVSCLAVDPTTGQVTVAGYTTSSDLPTKNAWDGSANGDSDIFVARFDPALAGAEQLLWCTYLGGAGYDVVHPDGLAVGPDGRIAVAGQTGSTGLPTTANAYDPTWNGSSSSPGVDSDGVLAVFGSDGQLQSLSYFGGSGGQYGDYFTAVEWTAAGQLALGGFTESASGFPVTSGAFDTTSGGDGFLAVIDPDQSGAGALQYSTYFGNLGGNDGGVQSIELDALGDIVFTGSTYASVPTTPGAFDPTSNGTQDGYVGRLRPAGLGAADLLYATYLGGSARDIPRSVEVAADGSVIVVGQTESSDFPMAHAYDGTYAGGNDMFVTRISMDGLGAADLLASTFLGGADYEVAFGVDVGGGSAASLLVTGVSGSSDFPTTPDAVMPTNQGGIDVVVAVLDLTASPIQVVHGTYVGGSSGERNYAGVLAGGQAYIGGRTPSSDMPVTAGAHDTSLGGTDAFVGALSLPVECLDPAFALTYGTGWAGTQGVPTLTAGAGPALGTTIVFQVTNAWGVTTPSWLFLGVASAQVGTAFGGSLLVAPGLPPVFLSLPGAGLTAPYDVPSDPALCGVDAFLQIVHVDPGASAGFAFSPGLQLHYGS